MKTYSQAGQDLWVLEKLPLKPFAIFLDIGAGHPIEGNNTFLLEQMGWIGFALDKIIDSRLWKYRNAATIEIDALDANWDYHGHYDYLSLDIDENQLEFVRMFPWDRIRFCVMTVEHDAYRFGNAQRDEIRDILTKAGYVIDRKDIAIEGVAFEDWWIDPNKVK